MEQGSFKYIDHPSDIGIEVEGKSLEGLFQNAAIAMLSLISEKEDIRKDEEPTEKRIHLAEECTDELLHSFLSEILWLVMQERFFPLKIRILTMREEEIDATLSGIPIQREEMKAEIKAITYLWISINNIR